MGRKELINAWKNFISTGEIDKKCVREAISYSWLRSKLHGVDPFRQNIKSTLSEKELKLRYEKFMPLIKKARPFMESLNKIVENSGLIVRLIDKEGYVIECIGKKELVEKYRELNLDKGSNVKENVIGTNAIGIALIDGKPIQVVGAEHYCEKYHNWTSSACPITDEDNRIIGVLSMTGPSEDAHLHTLGMVIAASEAIENEIKLDKINKRLDMANKHFYAIMESISEGLICVDDQGVIMDINLFARRFLRLKEEDILNKNIHSILDKRNYRKLMKVIDTGKKLEEEEIYFKTKRGKSTTCMVSVTPIKAISSNEVEGIVLTFREEKVIHKLVNKILGAQAKFTFDDILGKSEAIKEVKKMTSLAANTEINILLLGESGTGKEMFAQAIHNESNRHNKAFVALNCGAIPRELVASELFGYEEGAFTGARRGGHHGKFELADGGTIFLDEIGDMPLDTQVNLLRVLETKQIVRVGGHKVISTDVRVIAATHKDLKKEVERGNFREDLFYRLNVMPINITPLRERKEDIKIFIDYFVEKFSENMKKEIKGIDESFYKVMNSYHWPGNVRELQNVVQLATNIVREKEQLQKNHLPKYILNQNIVREIKELDEGLSLVEIERAAIIKTIKRAKGNLVLASKILGIGRSTLYRKMEKYGIGNGSK
ncbi:sigma 54-interacting transcriptional regulator [Lutibacter sp. B2]|nr:sigma 54-interacting transcriptional regulator [Lutibacter sp. B2]